MDFEYRSTYELPDITYNCYLEPGYDDEDFYSPSPNAYGSVRIKSIELENFKGIKHGIIDLMPSKQSVRHEEKSNILALYGQNGSGKTSVIDALYILKEIMAGKPLSWKASSIISSGESKARIKVCFEYRHQYLNTIDFVTYSFSIVPLTKKKRIGYVNEYVSEEITTDTRVCEELLTLSKRDYDGKLVEKTRKLFDSESKDKVLNCMTKKYLARHYDAESKPFEYTWDGIADETLQSMEDGTSIIFSGTEISFIDYVVEEGDQDAVYAILPNRYAYAALIRYFVCHNLYIAGANEFKAFTKDMATIYLRDGYVKTYPNKPTKTSVTQAIFLIRRLNALNNVLCKVVPGLTVDVEFKDSGNALKTHQDSYLYISRDENGRAIIDDNELHANLETCTQKDTIDLTFFTMRGGIKTPLNEESEGIKRLIYSLDLFVTAYRNPGVTVVIDEFDAGVFEYLLGEMLRVFKTHGKGQLIFTSHNLRPLEVLDPKSICFTTVNPDNRYIRMKYINQTNNLRDVYYRQILVGEQDEDLYQYVDTFELLDALEGMGDE